MTKEERARKAERGHARWGDQGALHAQDCLAKCVLRIDRIAVVVNPRG